MAPEVFRHEPYNNKVDVYSFSMILYQLFEHMPPFSGMDPVEAARQAALFDKRPQFHALSPPDHPMARVRAVMEACWDPNPERRPSFEEVVEKLEGVMAVTPRPDFGSGGGGGGCCAVQ